MKKGFHVSLRPGERIYVNGAVLRVDRKVSVEFLNDVTFLLENHMMQPHETTTTLRQLYFIVQTMLVEPANAVSARQMFDKSHALLLASFENEQILAGLEVVRELVGENRPFEALKALRALFPVEDSILAGANSAQPDLANPPLEVA